MKFLLVALNAKYIHSNPAIHSLRAYAVAQEEGAAEEIELAEYTINQPVLDILADIYVRKPDVAAFSCYIWNREEMRTLTLMLAKVMPKVPIWLGGPEVSYDAEAVLEKWPYLSGVMAGEGEETFYRLFCFYRGRAKECLGDIAGLVFRDPDTGKIIATKRREAVDISGLPFFYGDLSAFQNRIVYYESGRGCPFCCSYCLSSLDRQVRLRDRELVKKELQFFLDEKVAQVKFIDRTFNWNHAHAQEIWKYIGEHDNGVTNFHFEIAADLLLEEELTLLSKMRPGAVQLEIGVQSANPDTLREIRRATDMEKLRSNIGYIRAGQNIHVHLDLIAGLPCEDLGSFGQSFDWVYALGPQQLQLGFLKVLKGSPMERAAKDYGIVYADCPPYEVLSTRWLSYGDLIVLKRVEKMVELYYNSCQFSHILPVLESRFAGPFAMFRALADYYGENGYFTDQPSRVWRYQVLLEFAIKTDGEREALYRELLVYDLYLRENAKSRPAFARGRTAWKERIGDFYKKEEAERRYLPGYKEYQARQLRHMTHVEIFAWPVQKPAAEVLRAFAREPFAQPKRAVLFDYSVRDPLTANARTVEIEL